jgi:2-polyprenyl-3-methyl-5-hydroxy-6-metoxy-1,4-benzoquinol methylase
MTIDLEIDEKAIQIVDQYCESVCSCDLNSAHWPSSLADAGKFEVIVAGDVLEHLYDPWGTVDKLKNLLAEDGCIVISLPHFGHNAIIASLLDGDFNYQPWGLLDKTHIRFFGIKNLQSLFNDAGFKIIEADFVIKTPEQTEFARAWRKLSSEVRQILSSNRFGTIYQVVIKAVPEANPGKSLRLESLLIPSPPLKMSILGYILSFISLHTRERLFALLKRIGLR